MTEEQERHKETIFSLAMQFVEAYHNQMRGERTSRDEDIAAGFTFGFNSAIKTVKSFLEVSKPTYINLRDSAKNEADKIIGDVVVKAIEMIETEVDAFDCIHTNDTNKDLN